MPSRDTPASSRTEASMAARVGSLSRAAAWSDEEVRDGHRHRGRAAAAYGRWEAARRRAASSATPAGLPPDCRYLRPARGRRRPSLWVFHVVSPQIVPNCAARDLFSVSCNRGRIGYFIWLQSSLSRTGRCRVPAGYPHLHNKPIYPVSPSAQALSSRRLSMRHRLGAQVHTAPTQ